jgi:hypothetical protein
MLRKGGITELDPWWLKIAENTHGADKSHLVIKELLNEHYSRLQKIYVEVVQHNFSNVASEFNFFSVLPVRWDIVVVVKSRGPHQLPWMYYRWMPVANWDDAGADVEFAEAPPDRLTRPSFDEVKETLIRFGRFKAESSIWGGGGVLPRFDGNHLLHSFDGETSALREACDLILGEIKRLFSAGPSELWTI